MSQDLTREWAPVYPHIRYDDPGAAIDWAARRPPDPAGLLAGAP